MNIVVLRYGGLGDILLATPLLRSLMINYPKASVTFVTESGNVAILKNSTLVKSTIGIEKLTRSSLVASFTKGRSIRSDIGEINLYVNLQPSLKSLVLGYGLDPKETWTFRKDRRIQKETGKVRHAIDDFLNVLPGGVPSSANRQMEFVLDQDAYGRATDALHTRGIDINKALLINPAGTRDINRWPPVNIAGLIRWVNVNLPELTPVLIGGPGDVWLETEINRCLGVPVESLVGSISLQELGALMKLAAITITGDTGPLHIAAAVGARIVCLSGAADPDRTGPSNNHRDLVVINRSIPCVPCQGRTCKRRDIACMTQMSVESVVDALERRIKTG